MIARNYKTRGGSAEVDLIARDGEAVVFVEVKTRASEEFGPPDRAVDAVKQGQIVRAAADYLRRAEVAPEFARFDIVSIVAGKEGLHIRHIQDAFRSPFVKRTGSA